MENGKLTTKTRLGYCVSEAGLLIISFTLASQIMYFMTDHLGISAAAAGAMFLVSRIWDAINDPIMGVIVEKTNTKWGKCRPYLLWGGVPAAISLVLNLLKVNFGANNLIWIYVVYIFFGMTYTMTFIPYTTMISSLTDNTNDRAKLSSTKAAFQGTGVLFCSVLTVPLLTVFGGGQITSDSYLKVAVLFGCIALAMFAVTFATVRENPRPPQPKVNYSLKLIVSLIFKNRNLMLITLMYFLMYMRIFLNNSAAMYYFRYSRQDMTFMPVFMGISAATSILGAFYVPALSRKFGKKKLVAASVVWTTAFYLLLYFFRAGDIWLFNVSALLMSVGAAVPFGLIWAFVADITDATAKKFSFRADGILYSTTSFANKFAAAISGFVSGAVMSATGYIANQPQTEKAIFGIDCIMFIIPTICMALIIIPMFLYKSAPEEARE